MANTVDKVIDIALAEVGYLEKKSNYNLYSKTDNAGKNNYTKYGKEMHELYPSVMDYPAAWCDAFVDWCFYKAYGITTAKSLVGGDFNDYTVSSAQMYKNKKAWYTSDPKIGDQVFFKNSTRICHTGLVYLVDSVYIYTVEGNTSTDSGVIANGGCVAKKRYKKTNSKIAGYGRPKYDVETTKQSSSSTSKSLSENVVWYGVVTASSLNVRTWAGTENKECSFSPLKKNTLVGVCDSIQAKDGSTWYYIKYNNKYGFVHSNYISKQNTYNGVVVDLAQEYDSSVSGTYKTTTNLNLRSGAGTGKTKITTIPKNEKLNCYGYYTNYSGVKWYLVEYSKYIGFVSSKYCTKV